MEAFAEGKDLAVMSYKPNFIFESNERERRERCPWSVSSVTVRNQLYYGPVDSFWLLMGGILACCTVLID